MWPGARGTQEGAAPDGPAGQGAGRRQKIAQPPGSPDILATTECTGHLGGRAFGAGVGGCLGRSSSWGWRGSCWRRRASTCCRPPRRTPPVPSRAAWGSGRLFPPPCLAPMCSVMLSFVHFHHEHGNILSPPGGPSSGQLAISFKKRYCEFHICYICVCVCVYAVVDWFAGRRVNSSLANCSEKKETTPHPQFSWSSPSVPHAIFFLFGVCPYSYE